MTREQRAEHRAEGRRVSADVTSLIRKIDNCFGVNSTKSVDIERLAKIAPDLREVRERMDAWFSAAPAPRRKRKA